MRISILAAALLAATPAAAATPWGDGLNNSAPIALGAQIGWHSAWGATQLQFFDATGAIPFHTSPSGSWSVGMNVDVGLTHMAIPEEHRSSSSMRSLAGELQFTFFGPERASHHGFGLLGGGPFTESAHFWRDPNEIAPFMGTFYDGYVVTRWVDVSLRAEASVNGTSLVNMTGAVAVIAKPTERIGLHLGVTGGLTPTTWAVTGVRVRPIDGIELGIAASVPLAAALGGTVGDGFALVRPSVEFRVYAPRRDR